MSPNSSASHAASHPASPAGAGDASPCSGPPGRTPLGVTSLPPPPFPLCSPRDWAQPEDEQFLRAIPQQSSSSRGRGEAAGGGRPPKGHHSHRARPTSWGCSSGNGAPCSVRLCCSAPSGVDFLTPRCPTDPAIEISQGNYCLMFSCFKCRSFFSPLFTYWTNQGWL